MSNSQLVTLWECLFILQGVKANDIKSCDRADLEDACLRIYENLSDFLYQ